MPYFHSARHDTMLTVFHEIVRRIWSSVEEARAPMTRLCKTATARLRSKARSRGRAGSIQVWPHHGISGIFSFATLCHIIFTSVAPDPLNE
jgi:hypothetical protein